MLQYYSYALAIRDKSFSLLHASRKLFHQYLVDAYTKIEANRLRYIKTNQKELRCEVYKGLMDFVREKKEGVLGRLTVLPSSFKVFYNKKNIE
jgi:hypothetical protein